VLDKVIEIFPGIDLKVTTREDVPGWYVIKIINKKLGRERLVSFHASINQVADCVNNIMKLRNSVFEAKRKA